MKTSEKIKFTKMEALGNDIILIDARKTEINSFHEIGRLISDRKFGVGADNVIFLMSGTREYDYKVIIINPDGSEASMCGNALLCLGRYTYDNGLMKENQANILTRDGIKNISYLFEVHQRGLVSISLGKPRLGISNNEKIETIQINNSTINFTFVHTGAPHTVVFLNKSELREYPVNMIGPMIEHNSYFASTTNVMFAEVINENEIEVRCWERGGTGESLACGTGACAVAYAASLLYKSSEEYRIKFSYGQVKVTIDTDKTLTLTGRSNYICTGELNIH